MAESRGVIWRYYAYSVTNAYGFYLPVGILYLTEVKGFGLDVVGLTGAAFLFAEVLGEVPTGYVGDRLGRRASLALGNLLSAIALAGYVVADSPLGFVALNVVWAFGWGFRSGTGQAWLYEVLDRRGEAGQFARISGRASTALLLVSAAAAVAGGALVTVDWALPFLANAALSLLGIPILVTLPAASGSTEGRAAPATAPEEDVFTVRDALATLRLQVDRPEIRWFVAFAAVFYALFELSRTFEQPAMAAAGVSAPALGVLYAGFKLVQAGAASQAGRIEARLGTRGAFALLVPVFGVAYAAIAVTPLLVVPVVFLTRGVRSVFRPLRDQYLNDRIADAGRATVLSGATMLLSLAAGAVKLAGGWVAEATGPIRFLAIACVGLAAFGGLLWLAVSPVRPMEEAPVDGSGTGSGSGSAGSPTMD